MDILTTDYDRQTIQYTYDALARVRDARYYAGTDTSAPTTRRYQYAFDLAGNRTQQVVTVGTATTTDYEYTAVNQILRSRVNGGAWTNFSYDNNGNLTTDGTRAYTWDLANRLASVGGTVTYKYDGLGNRIRQADGQLGGYEMDFLLDLQPGLAVALASTKTLIPGGSPITTTYVHGPRGIHAQNQGSTALASIAQDGLGSVRSVLSNEVAVLESRMYEPFGMPFGGMGSNQTMYGFTGEPTDADGLVYLRARYYNPAIGMFTSADTLEGLMDEPLSLNHYGWVLGNVINLIDPSGLQTSPRWRDPGVAVTGGWSGWRTRIDPSGLSGGSIRPAGAPSFSGFGPTQPLLQAPNGSYYFAQQAFNFFNYEQYALRQYGLQYGAGQFQFEGTPSTTFADTLVYLNPNELPNQCSASFTSPSSLMQPDIDERADLQIDQATDENNLVHFVHGTTTLLWPSGYNNPRAVGVGDFGKGFYTFADTSWGRNAARAWALRQSTIGAIIVIYKISLDSLLSLNRMDVSIQTLNSIYLQFYPDRLTNKDIVVGPVGINRGGRRVANLSLPPQFKFESQAALNALVFDSVINIT